jgi:uncharacterized YigZ family protein
MFEDTYKILVEEGDGLYKEKGSKFIAKAFAVHSEEDVKARVAEFKKQYFDARHHCYAFIMNPDKSCYRSADDGEPSGTAGRPMLDVVKGRNVTNLLLTVTRWFGGTLLGTGGLVKAYGDSAKLVLDKAFEENAFEEYIEKKDFLFEISYDIFDKVKHSIKDLHIQDIKEDFGASILISGKIYADETETLSKILTNLTNGKTTVSFL